MNKKQWFVISIAFFILIVGFIALDKVTSCPMPDGNPLTTADLYFCINAEILDPFIYIFFVGMITALILGHMEEK